MELGLQFEEITAYETVETQAITHEETMETAIPEYCPDISRIVDTAGQLCIREKSLSDDHYTVSGVVKVTVLYTSEEVAGLKSLQLSVPFSCRMEDRSIKACKMICVKGRLLMLEARAITSRRLYLRVLPEISGVGFRAVQRKLCSGTEEENSIRLRREKVTMPLMTGAAEEEFTYTGEVMLEGTMPEELFFYRVCPKVISTQRVGNKLMVKGELWLCAMYRTVESLLERYETNLAFSQIVEAGDLPESARHVVIPMLCESDARLLRTEEGGGFGVTARIALCMRTYEDYASDCVADLYSTSYDVIPEQQGIPFPTAYPPAEIQQEVVLQPEILGERAFITNMECTQVIPVTEENRQLLRTSVNVHLLYLDDSGAPSTLETSQEVSLSVDSAPTTVHAYCGMESLQCGTACQIRIPILFRLEEMHQETIPVITSIRMEEFSAPRKKPSLVLRRLQPEETLWDVAKQYHTDEDAIRQANSQDNGEHRMLLIPCIR